MKKNLVKIVAFVLMAVLIVGLSAYYSGTSVRAENAASEQDAAGKRVYFAGPLFNEAEREYNLKLVTILESYGYEVFLPQRDGFLAPELEGKTAEEKTQMIFQKDRDEVLKADILFMVLDGRNWMAEFPTKAPALNLASPMQAAKGVTVSRATPDRLNLIWTSIP